jgi:adenosylcobinamide-GDP ribazoletransferase
MRSILLAIQFLTILPVRLKGEISESDIARCAAFFPLAGAVQGLMLFTATVMLSMIFPADVVSGFVIALAILINGGFHLDGLADTFDALAVKSSGDPARDGAKRLSVMKDSVTGAIGVVAIVTVILLKFILIKNVLSFPVPLTAFLVFSFMPVFSKWLMVPAMYHGTSARNDGLGRLFIGPSSSNILIISSAIALVLFILTLLLPVSRYYGLHVLLLAGLFPAGYLLALSGVGFFTWRFGGLTGDTLGSLSEIGEIFYLTGSFIWLQHFI